MSTNIFLLALILAASGAVSPPLALFGGLIYGFVVTHPFHVESERLATFLLQASVVALGFGMNLNQVEQAGRSGFVYTAVSITVVMLLGLALGRLLRVGKKAAFLISAGTAICGGSAIAAVGPIADANEEEMAISLGAVFILNSLALLLFPLIGSALHMTPTQFGLWSALAIHDTSSVVGATAKFGPAALAIGTTAKLTRALWIIPLSLITAGVMKSKRRIRWPWFILFFCAAALLKSLLPALNSTFGALNHLGKIGLTVTLFLIGTKVNRRILRQVGLLPLIQALALWVLVGTGTLAALLANHIRISLKGPPFGLTVRAAAICDH